MLGMTWTETGHRVGHGTPAASVQPPPPGHLIGRGLRDTCAQASGLTCSFPIWGSVSEAARMPIVLVLGRPDFSLRCELSALAMAADALLPLLGCRLVARAGEDADARLGHGPNAGIRVRRQHLLEGVQDRLVPD